MFDQNQSRTELSTRNKTQKISRHIWKRNFDVDKDQPVPSVRQTTSTTRFQYCLSPFSRSVSFHDETIPPALKYFPKGKTSDLRWFILENVEILRNGMVRAPFEMTSTDKLFRTIYSDELIYEMGTVKIHQNLLYSAFCFHNSYGARELYRVILIHFLNY